MDYDTLKAGPALDALVAEKVMGWRINSTKDGGWPPGSKWETSEEFPRFSTEIASAWTIHDKFHADGLVVVVGSKRYIDTPKLTWYAIIGRARPVDEFDMRAWIKAEAEAETDALAICRAALKAVHADSARRNRT